MSKHTPGPWEFRKRPHEPSWTIYANGNSIMGNERYYPWVPDKEDDWRLIAAAPELFDVLKDVVELWNHHCYAHGDGNPTPLHSRARAAVNKAQGIST